MDLMRPDPMHGPDESNPDLPLLCAIPYNGRVLLRAWGRRRGLYRWHDRLAVQAVQQRVPTE